MTWTLILQNIIPSLVVAFIIWVAGSTVWLVSRVITQKHDLEKFRIKMDSEISKIKSDCKRHQLWGEDMQKSIGRMDRNVVKLCVKGDISYEEAKS